MFPHGLNISSMSDILVGGRIYISNVTLKNCPNCKSKGSIRQIIWGMPEFPVDESKYSIGGCCVSPDGNDPTHECIKCGWERFAEKKELFL